MATIKRVSVRVGKTVNIGNYESVRVDVGAEVEGLEPGQTLRQLTDQLRQALLVELKHNIKESVAALRS